MTYLTSKRQDIQLMFKQTDSACSFLLYRVPKIPPHCVHYGTGCYNVQREEGEETKDGKGEREIFYSQQA